MSIKNNTALLNSLLEQANNLPNKENLDEELTTQNALLSEQDAKIAELAEVLAGKASGGGESPIETCKLTVKNLRGFESLNVVLLEDGDLLATGYTKSDQALRDSFVLDVVKNSRINFINNSLYKITTEGLLEPVAIGRFKVNGDGLITAVAVCYVQNTTITLDSGELKKVQDITYNDKLLVWDFDNGCYTSAYPLWIKEEEITTSYYHCVFENGIVLDLVGSDGNCHAVYCMDDNCFDYANNCVGKMIMTESGPTKLLSCELKNDIVKFYNIITNYHINCYANGVLTSTKLNNIYPIEDMKFIKENRQIIPIETFDDIPEEFYHGLRLGENKIENINDIKDNLAIKLSKMLPKEV